jgi:hypothetical protein
MRLEQVVYISFANDVWKEDIEINQTLKLSDAFIARTEAPKLELIVQLLNINYDKGNSMLRFNMGIIIRAKIRDCKRENNPCQNDSI